MNKLEQRIIDISYRHKLAHLSSTLSAVNIIDEIYQSKRSNDIFILSSGHAALALYVVMEKYLGNDAELLLEKYGVHPHRNLVDNIYCSTGSLGMGLTVAVGYALADKTRDIYCLISDGEANEGSIWEALRFIHDYKLDNLQVYANVNGMIAYDMIDRNYINTRLSSFLPRIKIRNTDPPNWPFAQDVLTHYYILKDSDLKKL